MWMIRRLGLVMLVLGFIPPLLLASAFAIAAVFGCHLTKSGFSPCTHGIDAIVLVRTLWWLGAPSTLFVTPPALGLVIVWLVAELIHFLRARLAS